MPLPTLPNDGSTIDPARYAVGAFSCIWQLESDMIDTWPWARKLEQMSKQLAYLGADEVEKLVVREVWHDVQGAWLLHQHDITDKAMGLRLAVVDGAKPSDAQMGRRKRDLIDALGAFRERCMNWRMNMLALEMKTSKRGLGAVPGKLALDRPYRVCADGQSFENLA